MYRPADFVDCAALMVMGPARSTLVWSCEDIMHRPQLVILGILGQDMHPQSRKLWGLEAREERLPQGETPVTQLCHSCIVH